MQVGAKIPPVGELGAGEQQRRQEQYQREIRIEFDVWSIRDERKRDAAQNESCSGRHANAPRNQFQGQRDGH